MRAIGVVGGGVVGVDDVAGVGDVISVIGASFISTSLPFSSEEDKVPVTGTSDLCSKLAGSVVELAGSDVPFFGTSSVFCAEVCSSVFGPELFVSSAFILSEISSVFAALCFSSVFGISVFDSSGRGSAIFGESGLGINSSGFGVSGFGASFGVSGCSLPILGVGIFPLSLRGLTPPLEFSISERCCILSCSRCCSNCCVVRGGEEVAERDSEGE